MIVRNITCECGTHIGWRVLYDFDIGAATAEFVEAGHLPVEHRGIRVIEGMERLSDVEGLPRFGVRRSASHGHAPLRRMPEGIDAQGRRRRWTKAEADRWLQLTVDIGDRAFVYCPGCRRRNLLQVEQGGAPWQPWLVLGT